MHLQQILCSLSRHKLTAWLLAMEVAFTFAIVCNVAFMLVHYSELMRQPSGLNENELVVIDSSSVAQDFDSLARYKEDLAALRSIVGVQSVVAVEGLTLYGGLVSGATSVIGGKGVSASTFIGSPGQLATLGLNLVAGRDFLPEEYLPAEDIDRVPSAIITSALAERLFHGRSAVGQHIYGNGSNKPILIVGVIDHLLQSNPRYVSDSEREYSMLLPLFPDSESVSFVMRTSPENHERVLRQASAALSRLDSERILENSQSFSQLRDDYFRRDRILLGLLLTAAAGLLTVTAIGIAGLVSFWVQQRTRSIGIRRAIGARRRDILRYFMSENFLIVTGGIALGIVMAYALNQLLMEHYELPRLPIEYLPIAALALWLVSQLAALGPALRATVVEPAVASRSE